MIPHPPSWFVLSSEGSEGIHYEALISTVTLTILAFVIVILRWYTRARLTISGLKADDYFIFAALLITLGIATTVGKEFELDAKHKVNNRGQPLSMEFMLKLVFVQSILYHISINLVKTSLIVQYLRLFSVIPWVVYSSYMLLCLIGAATAWGVFGNIFLCNPVQRYWNTKIPGTCMHPEIHFWTTSVCCIVLDLAIWILPMPVISHLRLPRRQKRGLIACLGLGGFVNIISVIRLILVQRAASEGKRTKSGTYAIVFSTIEVNVAIICASVIVMKPLFARFIPSIVSEQPVSASEDRRLWRGLTGPNLLGGTLEEEHKPGGGGRRDTAIAMNMETESFTMPEIAISPTDRMERGTSR